VRKEAVKSRDFIEIYAKIKLQEKIILPTGGKTTKAQTKILLGSKLIQGDVPNFYANSYKPST